LFTLNETCPGSVGSSIVLSLFSRNSFTGLVATNKYPYENSCPSAPFSTPRESKGSRPSVADERGRVPDVVLFLPDSRFASLLLLFLYGMIEHTMNGMYLDVTITILSSLNRWFFVALMIFTSLEEVDSGMEGGAGLVLHRATDGPKLSELLPWWWRSESLPNEP
jgi:hypothetical protein